MTTTTGPRTRLAEQAAAQRGGADLFRLSLSGLGPRATFKRNGDGTTLIEGMDVLKAGTFNGLGLLDADLEAMVAHFENLTESGVFVPPFRIDHSWSMYSVVGWFEALETYRRVDTTDGLEKTFLAADVRITGSLDHDADTIVNAIKRGNLTNRSSEIGYYVTNSGLELPLVYYGCAFVDIPAVEGLGPVGLSRRPEPRSITNLTAGGGDMSQGSTEQQTGQTGGTAEGGQTDVGAVNAGTPDGGDASAGDTGGHTDTSPSAAGDTSSTATAPEASSPAAGSEQEPESHEQRPDDELSAMRSEIAQLRAERVDEAVARFRASGVLTDANEAAARVLLSHSDEAVRGAAGTILGAAAPRVNLGQRQGRTALQSSATAPGSGSVAGGGDQLIHIGMSKDEVGPLWANLSSQERKDRQGEYDAWRLHRDENGIRD